MIDQLGYKKYIIKVDQEPSTLELRGIISRSRGGQVIPEEPPAMDSRVNGFIEKAIQAVQGQIRTLKSALESRLGKPVPQDHPALPWLVSHAASLLNRYQRDANGRTPYRKL